METVQDDYFVGVPEQQPSVVRLKKRFSVTIVIPPLTVHASTNTERLSFDTKPHLFRLMQIYLLTVLAVHVCFTDKLLRVQGQAAAMLSPPVNLEHWPIPYSIHHLALLGFRTRTIITMEITIMNDGDNKERNHNNTSNHNDISDDHHGGDTVNSHHNESEAAMQIVRPMIATTCA